MHAAISFLECASCAMCPTKEPLRAGEHQESKVYYLEVLINYEVDAYNVCGVESLSPFGLYWIPNYSFFQASQIAQVRFSIKLAVNTVVDSTQVAIFIEKK